ncbi:MAG: glycosyltransferase [Sphingobacteriia bacterium]|nr:glycosyltransferase [Sphingobacteriia bacterium]NCC40394.1 glycosyltransferase [Gammaproteobacteria bacterium]
MRIAHLITGLELGGAERMLWKLLSTLERERFEPLVISLIEPGPMGEPISALGVEVHSLGMRRGLPSPRAFARLLRILRGFRPDLVQTWMYHADLMGALAKPLLGMGARRPRLVWNIRQSDLDPQLTRRSTRLVARLNGGLSHWAPDHILCCSQRAREVHRALGYRDDLMSLIPNGFDLEHFRPDAHARARLRAELGIPESTPLVGLVARFDPQKDLPTFVRAARQLRVARPDCRFLLCGQGMDTGNDTLRVWIEEADLSAAVHLLGPRLDMRPIFNALDLLVSSSAYGEGFPNVIGEAMACALPCVVTDVGDSGTIVATTGTLVPPSDPSALATAIAAMLGLPVEARHRLGTAARARIASEYALPVIAERYASLYRSLVTEHTSPAPRN